MLTEETQARSKPMCEARQTVQQRILCGYVSRIAMRGDIQLSYRGINQRR